MDSESKAIGKPRYFTMDECREAGRKAIAEGKILHVYIHHPNGATESTMTGVMDGETPEAAAVRLVKDLEGVTLAETHVERMPKDEKGIPRVKVLVPEKKEEAASKCLICATPRIGGCRCAGPHTLEQLKKGHGCTCVNGHRWSGDLSWDPGQEKEASKKQEVYAVDLDGTLAHHDPDADFDPEHIGEPVKSMRRLVRLWTRRGIQVVILTARASTKKNIKVVKAWLAKHGMEGLEVTNIKSPAFTRIYDDRAVQVEQNTGRLIKEASALNEDLPDEELEKQASVMALPNPDGTVAPLPIDPAWTGPAAIEHALKNLDLAAIEHDANEVLRRKLKSKRPAAVERLGFLDGLKKTGLTPADLMISRVPVIPPMYRPYSMAGATFVPGDANELYRDLVNLIGTHKKLDERLGGNFSGENRLRVYDAVRAVYGHGDPVVPKTAERGVSGFLKQITGVSPKFCYSSETEILTDAGWKYFFECGADLKVLTLNPETLRYEWEKPSVWVNYKEDGHMVRVETTQGSLLVTPGHTMWVRGDGIWQKLMAAELVYNHASHLYDLAVTPKAMFGEPLDSNTTPIIRADFEAYQGNVYCCSTQNGLLVVRRNGFATVSGNSFLQRKLVARDQDFTGRGTATLDPDLGLDEVGLPDEMAWKLYGPYVQRRLVRSGMRPADALQHITDRSTFADKHLDLEMKERPVMYSRAPAWHKFNTLGGWARRTKGSSISVNPLIGTGQNLDHDGDNLNVHVVSTPDAIRDVREKIMPSRMLHSIKERGAIVPVPKHEYLLGIHGAQTLPAQNKHVFASEPEALAAIKAGKVRLTDEVEIGTPGTGGTL